LRDYLREAFRWRWNLLALGAGTAFALLSPNPGAWMPLVVAAEFAYLAGLVSIPKFRSYVDRKMIGVDPAWTEKAEDSQSLLARILAELAPGPRERFMKLRQRCVSLRRIARGAAAGQAEAPEADDLRGGGLDKLLWVFLRLLYAQQNLWKFLEHTDRGALEKQLADLEARRSSMGETADERLRRSLTDAIATTTMRLDNLKAAESNSEFVGLELERIEAKILALSEMSVNNQNPDFISTQVDSVAESMTHAELAIRDLNAITGLASPDVAAPKMLAE
jgi:hypothetical protein